MSVQINPINIDDNILDPQQQNLVESKNMIRYFGLLNDFVQLYVYSNTDTLVGSNLNYTDYSIDNKEIIFYPEKDIENLGFRLGTYKMVYNFLRPVLTPNPNLDLFIKSISVDRREIKISTTTNNEEFYNYIVSYINQIQNRNYFIEFYLDLGNNNLVTASSIAVERDLNGNTYAIVKLFDALPQNIVVNSPLNVVEEIVNTQAFQAVLTSDVVTQKPTAPSLREANFSINVDDKRIGSTDYYSYNQILSDTGSSFQNILGFISSSNPTVNIDYTNYENFVHFGSISQRLTTFKNQLTKLESYQGYLNTLPITNPDYQLYQSKVNSILQGFQGYENYLYKESSSYAWPKSTSTKPYALYSITSSEAITWYNINQYSASYYDEFNNDNLVYGLPVYLQERDDFQYVKPFVHSMGQMFDDIWVYIKAMVDIWKSKNSLSDGISKDIVGDALQSLGIKLYTDGDQDDLYTWLYGTTNADQLFQTSSFQTAITASHYTLSGQDEAKSVFKRIYHNLPTLLKSKGTDKFVNYLSTLYGIPETILYPMEFGGVDKNSNSIEYTYNKYSKALQFSSSKYVYVENNTLLGYGIESLEFRFKPSASAVNQTLLVGADHNGPDSARWGISLVPFTSQSYKYANVTLVYRNGLFAYESASVSLPIYVTGSDGDYNWWNVALVNKGTGSVFYVKNELNGEIGFQASTSFSQPIYDDPETRIELGNVDPVWSTTLPSVLSPGTFSGQIQELRGWTEQLNEETINIHTLNPESYVGNTISSSQESLLFHFPLGNDLNTGVNSVTGSQPTPTTDYNLQFSNFTSNDYVGFVESYYALPAVGGYSTPVTDKIRIAEDTTASTRLQTYKSIVYNPTQSRTLDIHSTQVGFSPQDQINNDIISQLGTTYNLDDIIGNPQLSGEVNYQELETIRNDYFSKYVSSFDYKDFTQLIETFHKSLFRYLEDFIPGRSNNSTGVVIKPHILERSKVKRHEPNVSTSSYYGGETPTVSISSTNPLDEDATLSNGFINGEISGSVIDVNNYYTQYNPYVLFSDQEGTIEYPGFDLHVNDNWNIYLPSAGTWDLEIDVQHLGEELYITDLTSLASLGGLNMGPAGFYTLTITTSGTGIEFSNQGLWGMGYISINYVKAIRKSPFPRFEAQYAGYDALNNNVMASEKSQFKFKKLPTSSSKDSSVTADCIRYKVYHNGGSTNPVYYSYTDCNDLPTLCNKLNVGSSVVIDANRDTIAWQNPTTTPFTCFTDDYNVNIGLTANSPGYVAGTGEVRVEFDDINNNTPAGWSNTLFKYTSTNSATYLNDVTSRVVVRYTKDPLDPPVYNSIPIVVRLYKNGSVINTSTVSVNDATDTAITVSSLNNSIVAGDEFYVTVETTNTLFSGYYEVIPILGVLSPTQFVIDTPATPVVNPNGYAPSNSLGTNLLKIIYLATRKVYSYYSSSVEWTDSLLTDNGYIRSRESGVKTSSPAVNDLMYSSSIGKVPNVEQTIPYMLYYDWTTSSLAEKQGSANYHIKYLIDETGSVSKPTYSSSYYWNTNQAFGSDTKVHVSIYNADNNSSASLDTTVYRPLKKFESIIYSDTGSLGKSFLQPGYNPTMSFYSPQGFLTNVETYINDIPNLSSGGGLPGGKRFYHPTNYEAVKFLTPVIDIANGWNTTNYSYVAPGNFEHLVKITASVVVYNNNNANIVDFMTCSLVKNGTVISKGYLGNLGSNNYGKINVTASTTYNLEDEFYVTYNCDDNILAAQDVYITDVNGGDNTNFILGSVITPVPLVTSSYFTSSFEGTVLTASTALSYFYGSGYSQAPAVTNKTGSGFNNPLPFTIQQYDQIRFEGNEDYVYTIMSSSKSPSNQLYLHLDRTPQGMNLNYFSIRRLVDNPDFIILNAAGGGNGFIIPKYPTPTLSKNLSTIIETLSSKNLIP